MTEQTLTAMYDTQGAADAARSSLLALGIASGAVTIHGTAGGSASASTSTVDEDRGFWGSLTDLFMPEEDRHAYAEGVRRGGYLLSARVPEDMAGRAQDVLERSEPVDFDSRVETWRQSGWAGHEAGTAAYGTTTAGAAAGFATTDRPTAQPAKSTGTTATGDGETLQLMEEQVRVGKRAVAGGSVRVRSYVVERPVEEQVTLRNETVRVERRPVDRELTAGETAFQERTIEAVERDEEAVVSKTARVTEEIAIRKDVEDRTETVRDTVRKTEVEVEDDRTGHSTAGTERVAARTTPAAR